MEPFIFFAKSILYIMAMVTAFFGISQIIRTLLPKSNDIYALNRETAPARLRVTKMDLSNLIRMGYTLPYKGVSWILGKNVGIGEEKCRGFYIEHIVLFYYIVGPFLTISFPPKEVPASDMNHVLTAVGFASWLTLNAMMDCFALLLTKFLLGKIVNDKNMNIRTQSFWLFLNLMAVIGCPVLTQFFTNGLYALQIGHPGDFLSNLIDYRIAFKEYYFNQKTNVTFPGQVFVSFLSAFPMLFGLLWTFVFLGIYRLAKILDAFSVVVRTLIIVVTIIALVLVFFYGIFGLVRLFSPAVGLKFRCA